MQRSIEGAIEAENRNKATATISGSSPSTHFALQGRKSIEPGAFAPGFFFVENGRFAAKTAESEKSSVASRPCATAQFCFFSRFKRAPINIPERGFHHIKRVQRNAAAGEAKAAIGFNSRSRRACPHRRSRPRAASAPFSVRDFAVAKCFCAGQTFNRLRSE